MITKERFKDDGLNETALPLDLAVSLHKIMLHWCVMVAGAAGDACWCRFYAMTLQWGASS